MFYVGETVVVTHIIGENQQSAEKYIGKEGIVTDIDTSIYPITVQFTPERIIGFMVEELEPVDTNTEIESEESLLQCIFLVTENFCRRWK